MIPTVTVRQLGPNKPLDQERAHGSHFPGPDLLQGAFLHQPLQQGSLSRRQQAPHRSGHRLRHPEVRINTIWAGGAIGVRRFRIGCASGYGSEMAAAVYIASLDDLERGHPGGRPALTVKAPSWVTRPVAQDSVGSINLPSACPSSQWARHSIAPHTGLGTHDRDRL